MVRLSNALILAKNNEVLLVDPDAEKASIMDIMRKLKLKGINIIIYEPILNGVSYCDYEVIDSLVALAEKSDVSIISYIQMITLVALLDYLSLSVKIHGSGNQ